MQKQMPGSRESGIQTIGDKGYSVWKVDIVHLVLE